MNKFAARALPLALLIGGCSSAPKAPDPDSRVQRSFYLMGTSLDMTVDASSHEHSLEASEAAFRAARATERRLSTWIADSELARVNQALVGTSTRLSRLLARDLRNAYRCGEQTQFTFTPWIGPLVQAWGLRTGGKIPSESRLRQATRASRPDAFRWDGEALSKQDPHALVEEGAFGKGIGLDDALEELERARVKGAVLNFGGQVSILGNTPAVVEVSDPAHRDRTLLRFEAPQGSVSTSGNSEHGLTVHGAKGEVRVGHELDPRTGQPAPYDGSVTVFAATGIEADCLSTALFVMGPKSALEWSRAHGKQAIWIEPGSAPGKWIARVSCGWRPEVSKLSDQVEIRRECASRVNQESQGSGA